MLCGLMFTLVTIKAYVSIIVYKKLTYTESVNNCVCKTEDFRACSLYTLNIFVFFFWFIINSFIITILIT